MNMYLFTIILCMLKNSVSVPIPDGDYGNLQFEDEWNYMITPHSSPLLGRTSRNHILPPAPDEQLDLVGKEQTHKVRASKQIGNAVNTRVPCFVCTFGVGLLLREIKKGNSFEEIKKQFVTLCVLQVKSDIVCGGIFELFGPEILPSFNITQIDKGQICSLVLGETCGEIENPLHEWEVELPDVPKPDVDELPLPQAGQPSFKVLHLSDTHYDPNYVVGSISNCVEPLCCRNSSTKRMDEKIIPAGKWGSYDSCDCPRVLIENMLKHIAEEHADIDFIIWTGDLPAHDIWDQTKEGNLNIIEDMAQLMVETFPNTPIFPTIGNHESVPAGSFGPPWVGDSHTINWLYRQIANDWRRWLPASSGNTLLHGGFYSVLVREKFRLISLNTNYCHTLNWWLVVNSTDPAKELRWLIYELQEAENKDEKVMLIGHISPGSSDCMKEWSKNFYSIVARYESTIIGQFYGHSHADEFEMFYDPADISKIDRKQKRRFHRKLKFAGRPTNVAYLGPSMTTYDNFNPAYRIYYIDGDHDKTTREVIDHETWTMNLEEANEQDEPKWYRLYSAKNVYRMKSLRPQEWSMLIERMVDNRNLFDLFHKHYYRDSPTRPECTKNKCILERLCDLRTGKSQSKHSLCHDLELTFGS